MKNDPITAKNQSKTGLASKLRNPLRESRLTRAAETVLTSNISAACESGQAQLKAQQFSEPCLFACR